jgi:uncharacterized membrane protein
MTDTPNPSGSEPQVPAPGTPEPAAAQPATPQTASPAASAAAAPVSDAADIEQNKVQAILAYLGILVLIPILAAPKSKFARYHANQGLILLLTSIGICIVSGCPLILVKMFAHGEYLACCLDLVPCGFILCIPILAILGIINAVNGQTKPLPLIGGITLLK